MKKFLLLNHFLLNYLYELLIKHYILLSFINFIIKYLKNKKVIKINVFRKNYY